MNPLIFIPEEQKIGHSTPKWTDYDVCEPDFEFLFKYIFLKITIFFHSLAENMYFFVFSIVIDSDR